MEAKVPTKSERLQIDLPSNDRALPRKNQRVLKVLGIAGALALVLLGIFAWFQLYLKTGGQGPLLKTTVTRGRFEDVVTVTGRIEPRHTWDVAAPTGGRVQTVAVKPGDSVQKDQTLLVLANPELDVSIVESELSLVEAESENATRTSQSQSDLLRIEGEVAQLRAEASEASTVASNDVQYLAENFISKARAERSRKKAEALQERLDAEEKRLEMMRTLRQNEIATSSRALRLKRRAHDLLIRRRDALTIRSPESGVVTTVHVNTGQQASDGSALVELSSRSELKVVLAVPENRSRRLVSGMPVNVRSGRSALQGQIERIYPTVIDGYVTVDVELEGQPGPEFRTGRFVQGLISIEERDDSLVIARQNWMSPESGSVVYKLSDDSRIAVRTDVEFGPANKETILVESGLTPGDVVIASNTTEWTEPSVRLSP